MMLTIKLKEGPSHHLPGHHALFLIIAGFTETWHLLIDVTKTLQFSTWHPLWALIVSDSPGGPHYYSLHRLGPVDPPARKSPGVGVQAQGQN